MIIKKFSIFLVIICLMFMISGCGKEKETSTTEEVDLSKESKVIEAFGIVKAEESKDVIIDFPAVVLDVLVKEGQHVSLNEPILTLDLSQYQSQLADAKSNLNIAKLEQESAVKNFQGLTLEDKESEINKLKNDLEFSKKLYAKSVEEFKSKENLFKEGAISQDAFNVSKDGLDEAKKAVEDIEYELKTAVESNEKIIKQYQIDKETEKNEADVQTERITQIENNVASLGNKLIKPYIQHNQVVSEYKNALVYDIKYASGHITDTEQKAFTIVNIDNLTIEANVAEEFIKDVKVGESVKIVPVADRTKEYKGSIMYVSQMAFVNNGETVVPVRITVNNTDSFLLPNYNVDVFIDAK